MDRQIRNLNKKLEKEGKRGLALDIDNTLSDTSIVWVEKIALALGNPEGLTSEEFTKKYSYGRGVSYWAKEDYERVSLTLRQSNEFYEDLPLIENANKQVEKINAIIPIVAYITARNMEVIKSTEEWLKKHNFPKSKIICRPDEIDVMEQFEWKAKLLEKMYPSVSGIVDDSIGLVNALSKGYKGTVFLYNYNGVDEIRNDIKVVICEDWNKVLEKIKENYD